MSIARRIVAELPGKLAAEQEARLQKEACPSRRTSSSSGANTVEPRDPQESQPRRYKKATERSI